MIRDNENYTEKVRVTIEMREFGKTVGPTWRARFNEIQ